MAGPFNLVELGHAVIVGTEGLVAALIVRMRNATETNLTRQIAALREELKAEIAKNENGKE